MDRLRKQSKTGDKEILRELEFGDQLLKHLESGKTARSFIRDEETALYIKNSLILTGKPVLYVCNVDEASIHTGNHHTKKFIEFVKPENAQILLISAGIEAEITELPEEDRAGFFSDLGLTEPGTFKISRAAYNLLELITYFTAGVKEVRAWTIKKGMKAPQAAGVIHTDFEKGFIKAEVIHYDDFIRYGSEAACRDAGKLSIEGKEYLVNDGDVMHFRFNV